MKKSVKILSYIFEILLIASIIGLALFIALTKTEENIVLYENVISGALMLTSMFGAYYLILGCKKGIASVFYVCFMGATAVCDLLAIYSAASISATIVLLFAVAIAGCAVLCFAKDLGQNKSYIFALAALIAKIAIFVIAVISIGFTLGIMNFVATLLLSIVALFMVYAKYYDKALRGSN